MTRRNAFATLVGLMLLVGTEVSAAPIPITNPGFEDPAMPDGAFTVGTITGWVVGTGAEQGVFNPTTGQIPVVPEGSQVGYSNGGSITQALSANLTANTQYNLSVQVGHRSECCGEPTFTIELLAGATTLTSAPINYVLLTPGAPFITLNAPYFASPADAHLGEQLSIRLSSSGPQSDFDNVILDASTVGTRVPEPSTFLLLGSGVLALVVRSRPR
jgi:hypothetical protein